MLQCVRNSELYHEKSEFGEKVRFSELMRAFLVWILHLIDYNLSITGQQYRSVYARNAMQSNVGATVKKFMNQIFSN